MTSVSLETFKITSLWPQISKHSEIAIICMANLRGESCDSARWLYTQLTFSIAHSSASRVYGCLENSTGYSNYSFKGEITPIIRNLEYMLVVDLNHFHKLATLLTEVNFILFLRILCCLQSRKQKSYICVVASLWLCITVYGSYNFKEGMALKSIN
jgi:hypothetical protein